MVYINTDVLLKEKFKSLLIWVYMSLKFYISTLCMATFYSGESPPSSIRTFTEQIYFLLANK